LTINFLGTGTSQGVPVIACHCEVCNSLDFRDKRLRTSIHVEIDGNSFIIDSGPDFRQQVLREGIEKLDALIFTHAHKDHTAGMDDVRSFNFLQKRSMPVYGTLDVLDQLKREFSYIFAAHTYPGIPKIDLHEINKDTSFEVNGVSIIPIEVMHYKLPVLGFRFGDFTYITDANYISDNEKLKIKGSKVLVVNALQKEDHISHFNLKEAIALIEELKPEKAYLTHISHRMGMHSRVGSELPESVYLAYDGLKITV